MSEIILSPDEVASMFRGVVNVAHDAAPVELARIRLKVPRTRPPRPTSRRLVNLVTRGDELVCPICVKASENGPYTTSEARAMYPLHPRCRCRLVPVED